MSNTLKDGENWYDIGIFGSQTGFVTIPWGFDLQILIRYHKVEKNSTKTGIQSNKREDPSSYQQKTRRILPEKCGRYRRRGLTPVSVIG